MPMQTNWYSRGTFFRPQPDQKVDKKSNNPEFELRIVNLNLYNALSTPRKAPPPQKRVSHIPFTGSTTSPYMDKKHSILSNEFHILCCRCFTVRGSTLKISQLFLRQKKKGPGYPFPASNCDLLGLVSIFHNCLVA